MNPPLATTMLNWNMSINAAAERYGNVNVPNLFQMPGEYKSQCRRRSGCPWKAPIDCAVNGPVFAGKLKLEQMSRKLHRRHPRQRQDPAKAGSRTLRVRSSVVQQRLGGLLPRQRGVPLGCGEQNQSMCYLARSVQGSIGTSAGSAGDSHGNALVESVISLFKTEAVNLP